MEAPQPQGLQTWNEGARDSNASAGAGSPGGAGSSGHAPNGGSPAQRPASPPPPAEGGKDMAISNNPLWLDALNDPLAGLKTFSPMMHLCDLAGDGDVRFVVASMDAKLRVFRGTSVIGEHPMAGIPTCVHSFFGEVAPSAAAGVPAGVPHVAVAIEGSLYVYRMMRPYYKFVVPLPEVSTEEKTLWESLENGTLSPQQAVKTLSELSQRTPITPKSGGLLLLDTDEELLAYVNRMHGVALTFPATTITAVTDLQVAAPAPRSDSVPVLGTEDGRVLLLEGSQADPRIKRAWVVGSAPVDVQCSGVLAGAYRVVVATRDCRLFQLSEAASPPMPTTLQAPLVAMVVTREHVVCACMDENVYCYSAKGERLYSIRMPCPVQAMCGVSVRDTMLRHQGSAPVAIALQDGTLRVYHGSALVNVHNVGEPVRGLTFGPYSREAAALVLVRKSGALEIKFIPRNNPLTQGTVASLEAPPPRLDVPKKTKMFIELTHRERETATDMHRLFQRDLCKLRLSAAQTYYRVLTDGKGQASYAAGASLWMTAHVMGLGPRFSVVLAVSNTGSTPVTNLTLLVLCNEEVYLVAPKALHVPMLLPSVEQSYELSVECLEPAAPPEQLHVLVSQEGSSVPLLSVAAKMPACEVLELE
ncbi:unnamed protein product [Pedinophyceae sp. YPF-701]|nr:unnamed protein product [Pedinophyceae sp. YPF-701]